MAFAGKLNEPIYVYNFISGQNAFGEEVDYSPLSYSYATMYNPAYVATSYCTYYPTRAQVIYTGGARGVRNNEIQTPYTRSFIIRNYVPISDTSWIKWKDKYYRVTSLDESRQYQEITVQSELVNE